MSFSKSAAYALGLPVALVALLWVYAAGADNFAVPTPDVIASTFLDEWLGQRLVDDVLPSLVRFVIGVGLAVLLGIALGLAIGTSPVLRALTEPVFELFRALPPPVLIPVFMLFLGANDTMKVAIIVVGCIWPVLLNTIEGVRSIDPVQTETSRSFGVTGFRRIQYQVLPSAAPAIFAGVRQCLSIGLILMVISEMFASSAGLGFTIIQFQRTFAIPQMWSGILVLGLIGVAVSLVFQFVQRRVLGWYLGLKEVENAG